MISLKNLESLRIFPKRCCPKSWNHIEIRGVAWAEKPIWCCLAVRFRMESKQHVWYSSPKIQVFFPNGYVKNGGRVALRSTLCGAHKSFQIQEQYGPRHGYRVREQAIFVNTIRLWPMPNQEIDFWLDPDFGVRGRIEEHKNSVINGFPKTIFKQFSNIKIS